MKTMVVAANTVDIVAVSGAYKYRRGKRTRMAIKTRRFFCFVQKVHDIHACMEADKLPNFRHGPEVLEGGEKPWKSKTEYGETFVWSALLIKWSIRRMCGRVTR